MTTQTPDTTIRKADMDEMQVCGDCLGCGRIDGQPCMYCKGSGRKLTYRARMLREQHRERLNAAAPALYEALSNLAFSHDARDRGDGCWCYIEDNETYFERKGVHDAFCLAARAALALVDTPTTNEANNE